MKKNKLYNIMFPIWFLLVYPITWLVIIPVNFIIDTIVLLAGLKYLKINNSYEIYKKIILKVWVLGFAANIISGAFLFLTSYLPNGQQNSLYNSIINKVVWNPYSSILSILVVLLTILVSIVLLYIFNCRISFKKVGLERKKVKGLAGIIAIFTAPWILLFPFNLVYNNVNTDNIILSEKVVNETKSVEISEALNSLDVSTYIDGGVFDCKDLKLSVNCNINTTDEGKIKEYKNLFESNSTDELLNENAGKLFSKISYINDVVFKVSDDKTYTFNRNSMK
jgi:hypothetical protein